MNLQCAACFEKRVATGNILHSCARRHAAQETIQVDLLMLRQLSLLPNPGTVSNFLQQVIPHRTKQL